ncbi:GntR family transcriptional regulator [Tropicimonas sp. IMCC6043]|uniref:GntR family transcriptional regulator n=1 Tax=Tropicimonas sp. IMCC6043 TaxID=2510645 RepID=UPI00101E173F|nr:GntR family transcriptional regulator [Tropicimonas sp. IMCC6043]RYH12280.1 GntR family transcriptional regulator [Tropicimonas sp. IMCC6043]
MATNDNIAPLYAQVKQSLAERIADGEFGEGDFLPPEPDLCAELGVSRITLRRAVGELCDEGLLIRQQGRGTVVARRKVRQTLVSFSGFSDAFQAEGDVRHEIIGFDERARDDTAEALLEAGPLARVDRLISVDGRKFTLETLYLDSAAMAGVIGPIRAGGSFFQALRDSGGPEPSAADRILNVSFATPAERRLLGIGPTQPVFRIDKTVRDAKGAVISFSRLVTPAHLITYSLSC